ncbi:MAG: SMC-Scp complex subunit ScpB [Saccharofermentans sp.]|nr:SMC-Scp complex subunit ScpB [Saccharofermentans sp.]
MEHDEFELTYQELSPACEAILFASGDPIPQDRIAEILNVDVKTVEEVMGNLISAYENNPWGGLLVRKVENSYVMSTKPGMKKVLERMFSPKMHPPLSQASYETLAVIAYNQPVTRAQVEAVRGVSSDSIISRLIDRGWIEECGNLDAPGRPALFKTTKQFLMEFGISSVDELPSMELMSYQTIRDLEDSLAKAAGNDDRQITIEGFMDGSEKSEQEEADDGEHN